MRVWSKQASRALYSVVATSPLSFASSSSSSSCSLIARALTTWRRSHPLIQSPHHAFGAVLESPWSATQLRGAKFRGSDVVKAQHTVQGRGGACIQVELRDIDSGNKINERLRTDEAIEKVFVEEKPYTYLYTEDNFVVLAEPKTYDQLDVPKDLFGEAAVFMMKGPMSASVPQRVTCKVVEAQVPMKGIAATPHYKKVLLDNGLTVQVPAHVLAGDQIVVNTSDNSYITSCNILLDKKILGIEVYYILFQIKRESYSAFLCHSLRLYHHCPAFAYETDEEDWLKFKWRHLLRFGTLTTIDNNCVGCLFCRVLRNIDSRALLFGSMRTDA
ncbi:hypothetical protein HYC85_030962 [Camellia sinensis]|uniref:Translation elongation factor P/YeiP central domain-containing protein n=1 Tax=Camellia sinensis TaxID=4442 RepID=A0A7J7FPR9_CAMSI|nr:hypothetical protein HYC85_030962 [Camellia sinensis]